MNRKANAGEIMKSQFIALWLFSTILLTSAVAQEARTSGTEHTFTTKEINVWPGVAPGLMLKDRIC
jgi:hypothetical protein